MNRAIITAAAAEPTGLADFRARARIDSHEEDALLAAFLREGREAAEEYLWQRLITQTWDQSFDRFPSAGPLPLDIGPVQSIASVKYYDSNGTLQTLSSSVYELGDQNGLGLVRLKYNQTWPSARDQADAVIVRHVVGYGDDPADVPEQIRAAIYLYAAHRYRYRGGEPVPAAFYDLLRPFSFRRFG